MSTKSSQDLGNSEDVSQGNRKDSSENEGQGDRKGRPYNTTKKRLAEGVYGRGDHDGRPGSHDHHVSEGHSEILEQDLAHRWRALPLMQSLPLIDGGMCFLCYAGRSGGPQGPDIRDAVLQFALEHTGAPAERVTGDVEFHIRCSDWYAHQHHTDPRYNNVTLRQGLKPHGFFCLSSVRAGLSDGAWLRLGAHRSGGGKAEGASPSRRILSWAVPGPLFFPCLSERDE